MDLHLSQAEPTALERDAIDGAFAGLAHPTVHDDRPMRTAHAGHDARAQRHLLLPVLHAAQDAAGWISEGALNHIARTLSVPPAEIYGVATFYAMFSVEPRAPRVVHVCDDVACGPYGGEDIAAALTDALGRPRAPGEERVLGAQPLPGVVRARARGAPPARGRARPQPGPGGRGRRAGRDARGRRRRPPTRPTPCSATPGSALRRPGRAARSRAASRCGSCAGSASSTRRASTTTAPTAGTRRCAARSTSGPTRVITELEDSSLTGRGGAAFPTGVKWKGVAGAPERPHYLVCNADESEPGHVQGPRAHGGRPVRAHRVDDDRRLRHRRAHRLPLHPRRVPAGHPPAASPRSTPPAPAATSATT